MAMNSDDLARFQGRVVVTEVPNDLTFVPNQNLIEYDDPTDEAAAEARWRSILVHFDIRVLGILDIPQQSMQGALDGMEMIFTRARFGEYPISKEGYARWQAALAAGIPFKYYLYGKEVEEQFDHPTFKPIRKSTPSPLQTWLKRAGEVIEEIKRDPCIIGIIPLSGNRGVFCLLAKWLE